MIRRMFWILVAGVLGAAAAIAAIGRLGRDWEARVAVRGHSMEPTLSQGDWLLVDSNAFARRAPQVGDLVVAQDPRLPGRTLVKRVVSVDGGIVLGSDIPIHADDRIGPISSAELIGRPWFRYWPLERFGPIR